MASERPRAHFGKKSHKLNGYNFDKISQLGQSEADVLVPWKPKIKPNRSFTNLGKLYGYNLVPFAVTNKVTEMHEKMCDKCNESVLKVLLKALPNVSLVITCSSVHCAPLQHFKCTTYPIVVALRKRGDQLKNLLQNNFTRHPQNAPNFWVAGVFVD